MSLWLITNWNITFRLFYNNLITTKNTNFRSVYSTNMLKLCNNRQTQQLFLDKVSKR